MLVIFHTAIPLVSPDPCASSLHPFLCCPFPSAAMAGWLCLQFWFHFFFLVGCTTDPQSKPRGYRKKRKNSLVIMVLAWNLDFYTLCQTCFVIVLGSPLGDGWQKVFLSLNYLLKCKGDCISKYPQESCPVCVHLLSAKVRSLFQMEKVVPCLNFLPWLMSCLVDNLLFPNMHIYFFFFKSIHTQRYIWECLYNMY